MSRNPKTVSLALLIRRTLWTVVAPQRVFRQLSDQESMPWRQMFCAAALLFGVESFTRSYLLFHRWLYQLMPHDWAAHGFGFTVFGLNQWFLCVLLFLVLNQRFRGPWKIPAPLWMAGFHIITAFYVLSIVVDLIHFVWQVPPTRIPLTGWPWLTGPLVELWGHAALWVEFPWLIVTLWLAFRHFLKWDTRGRLALGAVLAVVLPLVGRFVIEPLPNVLLRALVRLNQQPGWSLDRWWPVLSSQQGQCVTLATQAGLALIISLSVQWWLRQPPLAAGHRAQTHV